MIMLTIICHKARQLQVLTMTYLAFWVTTSLNFMFIFFARLHEHCPLVVSQYESLKHEQYKMYFVKAELHTCTLSLVCF